MKKKSDRQKLSDQLRQAINNSGLSRYKICKEIGLDQASMSRFMGGEKGIKTANWDAIAELLNLSLVENDQQ